MPQSPERRQSLISIIVPVYNAAPYLPRCIDSILCQQYADFELILIDDGSTDASGRICDEYAQRDARVRVKHVANAGASSARNTGIDMAQGAWIAFVDADDYVGTRYLSDMYTEAVTAGSDLVITGCTFHIDGREDKRSYPNVRISNDHIIELFTVYKAHQSACIWGKLFNISVIEGLRFNPDVIFSEDILMCCRCYLCAKQVSLLSATNYYYNMHTGSLCHWIYPSEHELSGLLAFLELREDCERAFPGHDFAQILDVTKYLQRYIYSLYDGKKPLMSRMRQLCGIKAQIAKLHFKSTNIKERIYHFAIKYRLWLLVDLISKRIVPRSGLQFR